MEIVIWIQVINHMPLKKNFLKKQISLRYICLQSDRRKEKIWQMCWHPCQHTKSMKIPVRTKRAESYRALWSGYM